MTVRASSKNAGGAEVQFSLSLVGAHDRFPPEGFDEASLTVGGQAYFTSGAAIHATDSTGRRGEITASKLTDSHGAERPDSVSIQWQCGH
jgi:hypothetical protein